MLIIPAIDILNGQAVRLQQGDFNQATVYHDHPEEVAVAFAQNGVKRIHLVDLSGAKAEKSVALQTFAKIKEATSCVIEAGGGIRTLDEVENFFSHLDDRQDKVMIGSLPFTNEKEFLKICERYANSILLTVDVWQEQIRIKGWQEKTEQNLFLFLQRMMKLGINNFLVTQIKRDGMLSGPDVSLYKKILQEIPSIKLIASGGVSSMKDMEELSQIAGIEGAILGKAYYEKKVSLEQVREYIEKNKQLSS